MELDIFIHVVYRYDKVHTQIYRELAPKAMPGDLFVLRNAGNTCTHAEGSMVGSLEFCVSALKTRCILVMGHTECLFSDPFYTCLYIHTYR